MKHALIIERDGDVSRAIEDRLLPLGFQLFERAWTEDSAVAAVERKRPDLVVVGQQLDSGCPFNAARRICAGHNMPLLLAAPAGAAMRALPLDARLSGPFPIGQAEQAVREAQRASPGLIRA